ncbi:MAG: proton-conducting transporter membrane subunit [bacterium]|jgi:formate hydrogenlyase subunit 3/multisubunit Na+/H+ antiporter MnhD subunit
MDLMVYTVLIPLVVGVIVKIIPDMMKGVKEGLSLVVALVTFWFTIDLFRQGFMETRWYGYTIFRLDTLSSFILLWVGFFGVVMILYSLGFMRGKMDLKPYYGYMLMTLGAAYGAVLANDMVLLLAFWGFLAFTLYMLIQVAGAPASPAAKKTMIVVGGTDALMVLAVAIVWMMTGSTSLTQMQIPTITGLSAFAFILFACAAFAKAGAMPFHSWIPDAAEYAHVPVVAYLPASVDKLLGIYLLARISLTLFNLTPGMQLVLLIVGAFTIIAAVLMALVQHNLKRLLGYHAVSQVGYMVLGIGTLNPIGVAGGLFHMLNHAIYKGCLFLCAGSVENREKTMELDDLGGLAKFMPVTFLAFLVAALAISGIPPFNGFVSKWMVYQGVIEMGKAGGWLWVVWLAAAMFGSALTLASFMKALHAVFLGARARKDKPAESGGAMLIPMIVLSLLCLIFGIFAYAIPLRIWVLPAVSKVLPIGDPAEWLGLWSPVAATLLILLGVLIGFVIYLAGTFRTPRTSAAYIGGEVIGEEVRVTGVDFYETVESMGFFSTMYRWAMKKAFDAYDIGQRISFYFVKALRAIHSGVLPEYLTWVLAGLLVLLVIMLR